MAEIVQNSMVEINKESELIAQNNDAPVSPVTVSSSEVKLEEVTSTKPSALELLSVLVNNSEEIQRLKNEVKINIDDTTLSILRLILSKSPESLNKISELIKEVLSDSVLDYKDVPKLLKIVSTVYKTDIKMIAKDFTVTPVDIINFVKFIIRILIEKDVIPCNNKQNVGEIIDVSGELLEMVFETETAKNAVVKCTSCLPWMKKN